MFMRKTTALGLTALALALGGFVTAASASASEHWAGTSQPAAPFVPYGSQQEFTAEASNGFVLDWHVSGTVVEFNCGSLSTAGSVENPTGGGAGVVHSGSLTLTNCEVKNSPAKCEIENASIPLSPMSSTGEESGVDLIRTSGVTTTMVIKSRPGYSCAVAGEHRVSGQLALRQESAFPGQYDIRATGSSLGIDGYSATLAGTIALKIPTGKLLSESSTATPEVPHWFVGSSKWTTFSSGHPVNYRTAGAASVDISGYTAGLPAQVICGASGTGFAGSLENPAGGGAGTTSAQLDLGNCVLKTSVSGCAIPATITSNPLSGTAREVNGVPVIEYSPSEGKVLMTLVIQIAEGAKKCALVGSYNLSGKFLAASVGDGNFELSGFEQKLSVNPAVTSGRLLLESEAGEALRLQP
jgi:hypothetical protein